MPNNKAIAYFWTTKDEIVGGMYFKLVLLHTKACCNIYEKLLFYIFLLTAMKW